MKMMTYVLSQHKPSHVLLCLYWALCLVFHMEITRDHTMFLDHDFDVDDRHAKPSQAMWSFSGAHLWPCAWSCSG